MTDPKKIELREYIQRRKTLEKQYKWKAENIVRFLEVLKMSKEQKEQFIARELADAYALGVLHANRKTPIT